MTTRTRRRLPRASQRNFRPIPVAQGDGWYHISPVYNLAGDDSTTAASSADVYVYDVIGGWWGMTADDLDRKSVV